MKSPCVYVFKYFVSLKYIFLYEVFNTSMEWINNETSMNQNKEAVFCLFSVVLKSIPVHIDCAALFWSFWTLC